MNKAEEFREFVIAHEDDLFDCTLYEAWQRSKKKQQTLGDYSG